MPVRIIAREHRLVACLEGLRSRSRACEIPATLFERQSGDHRGKNRDSSAPVSVLATARALSQGQGMSGVLRAAGGAAAYYDGDGDGEFGGGGEGQAD